MWRYVIALIAVASLAACSSSDDGSLSSAEVDRLNDACRGTYEPADCPSTVRFWESLGKTMECGDLYGFVSDVIARLDEENGVRDAREANGCDYGDDE